MRICFAGTFNAGKTTAFNKCQEPLKAEDYSFLPERARIYQSQGTSINEAGSSTIQQRFLEELYEFLLNHERAICEDSPFSILAYTKLYCNPAVDIGRELKRFTGLIDRIILFQPIRPITDDGVRMTDPAEQLHVHGFIEGLLSLFKMEVMSSQAWEVELQKSQIVLQ